MIIAPTEEDWAIKKISSGLCEASRPKAAKVEQSLGEEMESATGDEGQWLQNEFSSHVGCTHSSGHASHHSQVKRRVKSILELLLCLSALPVVPLHGGHSHEAHFYGLN